MAARGERRPRQCSAVTRAEAEILGPNGPPSRLWSTGQARLHKEREARRDRVLSYLLGTVSEHLTLLPSMRPPAEP